MHNKKIFISFLYLLSFSSMASWMPEKEPSGFGTDLVIQDGSPSFLREELQEFQDRMRRYFFKIENEGKETKYFPVLRVTLLSGNKALFYWVSPYTRNNCSLTQETKISLVKKDQGGAFEMEKIVINLGSLERKQGSFSFTLEGEGVSVLGSNLLRRKNVDGSSHYLKSISFILKDRSFLFEHTSKL